MAGVPVAMHWSALAILLLVSTSLGGRILPTAYPGRPVWSYALAGTAAAGVFLAGLLAHEAAHALVAIRHGVPVAGITLWLLGGVSQLEGEAADPGTEVRIAGAGPLASLALAVGFGALAAAVGASAGPGLAFGTLVWLAGINVLLAVFNLLPAAPLDGGRLLRAGLWRVRHDRVWASVVAARAGRLFGTVMLALGLAEFLLVPGGFGGLWLALLGWFLVGAAGAEERAALLGQTLARITVAQVMSPEPATEPPETSVSQFLERHLFQDRYDSFPLVRDHHAVGLVTLDQVGAVPADRRAQVTLGEVASPLSDVPVVSPDTDLSDALRELERRPAGRALVVSDDELLGIVTPTDIARAVEHARLARAGRRT